MMQYKVPFSILLAAQVIGCSVLIVAPNYPNTLNCTYFVNTNGASVSFETLNGKTHFTMDEPVIRSLLESPNISDEASVKCRGNPELENGVKLGALYEQGYKLSSIKRQQVTVNGEAVPLPSWDYELKLIDPKK